MELKSLKEKLPALAGKYRYALLVLLVGIGLMLLPRQQSQQESVITEPNIDILSIEEQLGQILSLVHGAGKVQVMLTVASGEETLYQTNTDTSSNSDSSSSRTDTVTVTDTDRKEQGLIRQINPPQYLGAIIICQGADSPSVRLAIVEAVARITGLGADKISVLKMK